MTNPIWYPLLMFNMVFAIAGSVALENTVLPVIVALFNMFFIIALYAEIGIRFSKKKKSQS